MRSDLRIVPLILILLYCFYTFVSKEVLHKYRGQKSNSYNNYVNRTQLFQFYKNIDSKIIFCYNYFNKRL